MARENFDSELNRIEAISKYNKDRSLSMLDDMATAFISAPAYGHLDKSLTAVRVARKALRATGKTKADIDDYLLECSYISKTKLKHLTTASIYTDTTLDQLADKRPALFTERTTTDLIIDTLKSKPELLSALQRGVKKSGLQETYGVHKPTMLIDFYARHKSIIDN